MKKILTIVFVLMSIFGFGQDSLYLSGEISLVGGFAPDNELNFLASGRYLPQIDYSHNFKNGTSIDFEAAANLYGNVMFHPFDSSETDYGIKPYRLWLRFSGKQFEIRAGLQKINFGSANMLRPLQWFDDVDPSDPLQFTNGVYGILGKYYFLNNANIWLWGLYGNENPRGFESLQSNKKIPEFGGRVQLPVPKGEIAFSYHHRKANTGNIAQMPFVDSIAENKVGIDAKFDLGFGIWFEASYVKKEANLGILTNQTFINLGADYTLGIGNGIMISAEHLTIAMDTEPFKFQKMYNITSLMLNYPIGFFDNLGLIAFYIWETDDFMVMMNYQHDFKWFTLYLMPYYTPSLSQNILGNNYSSIMTGPGIRILTVFNY